MLELLGAQPAGKGALLDALASGPSVLGSGSRVARGASPSITASASAPELPDRPASSPRGDAESTEYELAFVLHSVALPIFASLAGVHACPSVRLSVCPSVCLPACLCLCVSMCLSLCIGVFVCVCASACVVRLSPGPAPVPATLHTSTNPAPPASAVFGVGADHGAA